MGIRKIKTDTGQPIEKVGPGDNVYRAVGKLYEYGRSYPNGRPHDYKTPEKTPAFRAPTPRDDGSGSYALGKNSPVSPAPDESQPQFRDDKVATHNDASGWVRGVGGQSPHPHFDRRVSGVANHKYRK
jgi:hypothetical protein